MPSFSLNRRTVTPRRLFWELEGRGELAPNVYLYAKCANDLCVNPDHMVWRFRGGRLPDERCKRNHDMTDEANIYWTTQGKRACRKCMKITAQARRKRYEEEGRGWGRNYRAAA